MRGLGAPAYFTTIRNAVPGSIGVRSVTTSRLLRAAYFAGGLPSTVILATSSPARSSTTRERLSSATASMTASPRSLLPTRSQSMSSA